MLSQNISDHPIIRNMELTGYPDGKEPESYRCPVCGKECETIFRYKATGEIVGCDICIEEFGTWEVECL